MGGVKAVPAANGKIDAHHNGYDPYYQERAGAQEQREDSAFQHTSTDTRHHTTASATRDTQPASNTGASTQRTSTHSHSHPRNSKEGYFYTTIHDTQDSPASSPDSPSRPHPHPNIPPLDTRSCSSGTSSSAPPTPTRTMRDKPHPDIPYVHMRAGTPSTSSSRSSGRAAISRKEKGKYKETDKYKERDKDKDKARLRIHRDHDRDRIVVRLSDAPTDALVQRLRTHKTEAKESRRLLRSALGQLEDLKRRAADAEVERRILEVGQRTAARRAEVELALGLGVTQRVLDAQQETTRTKTEAQMLKIQLDQAQRELQRHQIIIQTAEAQRANAEASASQARAIARELTNERLVGLAREEGRKLGYLEGVQQGRMLGYGENVQLLRSAPPPEPRRITDRTPVGSGQAFIEDYDEQEQAEAEEAQRRSRHGWYSREATPRRYADMPVQAEVQTQMQTQMQTPQVPSSLPATVPSTPLDPAVRQELDAVKERVEEMARRENEQREALRQWEVKELEREREGEIERLRLREEAFAREREEIRRSEEAKRREVEVLLEREREREKELERERNEERRRREERERELEQQREKIRELERTRERELERVREREKELEREMQRERAREEERERAREREREQERERERERQREREQEREMTSNASSTSHQSTAPRNRLPYLRMPPPPPQFRDQHQQPPSLPITPTSLTARETPPLPIPPPRTQPPVILVRAPDQHTAPPLDPPRQVPPPSYPRVQRRQPSSPDTSHSEASTMTGMSNLDILSFSNNREWERSHLSDIPEVPSVRSHSRASLSAETPSPSWLSNPPADLSGGRSSVSGGRRVSGAEVDQWRHSTSNEVPDSAATSGIASPARDLLSPSYQPRGRPNQRSFPTNQRNSSGSTVNITIEPPSRPHSSLESRDPENLGLLSPNSATVPRPLAPEPPQPYSPVIPTSHHTGDSNLPPMFEPYGTTQTDSTSTDNQSARGDNRRAQGRRTGSNIYAPPRNASETSSGDSHANGPPQGTRTGTNIYANFTSPSPQSAPLPTRSRQASGSGSGPGTRTGSSIYANVPQTPKVQPQPPGLFSSSAVATPTSRTGQQIYGPPASSPSVSGSQPLPSQRETPINHTRPLSRPQTQIYGPPATGSSNSASQTPRPIYAPTPPVTGNRPIDPPRIYAGAGTSSMSANNGGRPQQQQSQIYGPPASASTGSLIASSTSSSTSRFYPPAQPTMVPAPTPASEARRNNIYGPPASPSLPVLPLSTAGGRPTARSAPVVPPVVPFIPPMTSSLRSSGTPGSNRQSLGSTPRARFADIREEDEDEDEDDGEDHDEQTLLNTRANGISPAASQVPLPIPPPQLKRRP
ncbi:hypothetical protein H0H81_012393 [Sphagnurus paluster]|uniref:Uncharacterized protein n=1 Tax=Sphagnurus paluster TaxID=117069 RepID=A0A9P7GNV8_9AGAR|nr:hypothetical protein H0H81_012393 [Sphagnurus paluster]